MIGMTIPLLKKWIEENQEHLHIQEIYAPIDGQPSIVITLISTAWDKITASAEFQAAVSTAQHRFRHEIPALVQPPVKRKRGRPRKDKLFPNDTKI